MIPIRERSNEHIKLNHPFLYKHISINCTRHLTSSITNVQSLSSSSCVRGSLNNVTETVWLSGTAQLITPFNGLLRLGSQSNGSELTLLLRLVQTTLNLFGFLWNMIWGMVNFIALSLPHRAHKLIVKLETQNLESCVCIDNLYKLSEMLN